MRPVGKIQINVAMDREAAELIKAWAAHRRGYGDLLTRLIFEERSRREERQRILAQVTSTIGGNYAAKTATPQLRRTAEASEA